MNRTIVVATSLAALLPATSALAAKPPKPPKPAAPALSAAANPFVVTFGQSTTVAGRLTGANHAARVVRLAQDPFPYGDGFLPLAQTTTASNGNYSFHLLPALNTNYQVTSGALRAATGVRVRHAVGLSVSDSTPARGQRVRFFGFVRPKHDGKVVLIQRRLASGAWTTVRRTTLLATTGNRSRYSTVLRVFAARGALVNFRARFLGDGAHLTGTSVTRTLTVH
jgi:hypothetical protein